MAFLRFFSPDFSQEDCICMFVIMRLLQSKQKQKDRCVAMTCVCVTQGKGIAVCCQMIFQPERINAAWIIMIPTEVE